MHAVGSADECRAALERRRTATLVVGAAGAGWIGLAGVLARSPAAADALPRCPFKAITGLDCPGCGSTRSLGALTQFDVAAAFDHHVLVPVALVFVAASFVVWTSAVWGRSSGRGQAGTRAAPATDLVRQPSVTIAIAVVVLVFAVTRNLEFGEWLASTRSGP